MTRPARVLEAIAMFLQFLADLGTFLGGLGALAGGTAQLLQALKKKEGAEADRGGGPVGESVPPWMIAPFLHAMA